MADCYNIYHRLIFNGILDLTMFLVEWAISSEMASLATLVAGGTVLATFLGRHALAELHVEGGLTRH